MIILLAPGPSPGPWPQAPGSEATQNSSQCTPHSHSLFLKKHRIILVLKPSTVVFMYSDLYKTV